MALDLPAPGMAGLEQSAPAKESQNARDVILSLSERWNAAKSVNRGLPRIVSGQRKRQVVSSKQLFEVLYTGFDIYFRIEQVERAIPASGRRHHLHQSTGALWRDGTAVVRRFHLDQGADHAHINAMFCGRLRDERAV